MTNPIISTYDHATGQTTETEMTDSELKIQLTRVAKRSKIEADKATARQAVLTKLKLTEAELQALLG